MNLSKEEIEKAKEILNNPKTENLIEIIRIFKRNGIENYCITRKETIETLLQYIDQLEQENNKQNKIINEMALAISSYDIDEEICKNLATPFCNNEPLRVTADVCARCVKQYFEEKVEEK